MPYVDQNSKKAVLICDIKKSGYSETIRVRKARQRGAGAYVKKPFDIHTIGKAERRELKNGHR